MKQWIFSADANSGFAQLTLTPKTDDAPRMYRLESVDCGGGICGIRIVYDRADRRFDIRVARRRHQSRGIPGARKIYISGAFAPYD